MNPSDDANAKLDVGIVKPEADPAPSSLAATEAVRIEDGTLQRDESVKTHIHRAGLLILWSVTIGGLILAAIWVWHLATPDRLHFLTVSQPTNIQTVLLSAVGSSFATQAGKRWLNPTGDKNESSS
jgi:hypothetical protein